MHQGQRHQTKYEIIIVSYGKHKSTTIMPSLSVIAYILSDITIIIQIKHLSSLMRTCDLESRARSSD